MIVFSLKGSGVACFASSSSRLLPFRSVVVIVVRFSMPSVSVEVVAESTTL